MQKLLNKHLKQRTMVPPGNCIPVSAEKRNCLVGYSPPQFRWLWAEQQQLSPCVDFSRTEGRKPSSIHLSIKKGNLPKCSKMCSR